MMAIGAVIEIGTLITLFTGSLEVALFLAAVGLGFLLVGLQQEFDVLAVGADIKERGNRMVSKILDTVATGSIQEYRWVALSVSFILLWTGAFVVIALAKGSP